MIQIESRKTDSISLVINCYERTIQQAIKVRWTNRMIATIKKVVRMNAPQQSELPMRVAVCAWCKPKNRGLELGASLGAISHGICPRHLKQLRLELQKQKEAAQSTRKPVSHSRRRKTTLNHPELKYAA